MCRGMFAMTWFLLLSSTLTNLYLMYDTLIFSEIESQGVLMDAEELFYLARNFEYDFNKMLIEDNSENFLNYWSRKGNLTYGIFSEFGKKACIQVDLSFEEFLNSTVLYRDNLILFSPLETGKSCVTLEIKHQNFKTYGAVVSTICVNTSSPLLLC